MEIETSQMKETIENQNKIIADLQELLLKKHGIDMQSDIISPKNDNLQNYLFTDTENVNKNNENDKI